MRTRPTSWSCLLLLGCTGPQSFVHPAGTDAAIVSDLTAVMVVGALVIWGLVMAATVRAVFASEPLGVRGRTRLIVGGGVVFPTITLGALLAWGLSSMPRLTAPGTADFHVRVVGEQWWWRVFYDRNGETVELANELVLPLGSRVQLQLQSADVVHAFWVPSLAGKMDMIPGRTTFLALEPTRTGVFRGVCAEFCGSSHTGMQLDVVVVEPAAFETWLDAQRAPAVSPTDVTAEKGRQLFERYGCAACHTVRGTNARGVLGPDLTHLASRKRLGAGVLPNEPAALERWLREPDVLKPEVHMPAFGMLADDEIRALATWLGGLR